MKEGTDCAAEALTAAAGVYYFGVYPGDESEASDDEIRKMTVPVVLRFLEHMSREYVGDMCTERACGHLAQMVRDAS